MARSVNDMPTPSYRTIYVSKPNASFWTRGEELAKARGVSLSALLSNLLRVELMGHSTGQRTEPTPADLLAEAKAAIERAEVALQREEKI